jgi:phosphoglycolate phosphatase-like HAD superfamily hydrolase
MTIHEEQPVTAEPRIDDENKAEAVHKPEPATDDIGAETVREPEPVADAVEPGPAGLDHESSTAEMLFAGDDVADLRARWAGVQAAFVDNPKDCVQKADHLVSDLVEHLTTGFAQARSRLEEQWSQGQEASTEDLRVALMHYREFFDRLLAV